MKERAATFKLAVLSSSPPIPACCTQKSSVSLHQHLLSSLAAATIHTTGSSSTGTFYESILYMCFTWFLYRLPHVCRPVESSHDLRRRIKFPTYPTAPPAPSSSQLVTLFSHASELIPAPIYTLYILTSLSTKSSQICTCSKTQQQHNFSV